MFYEEKTLARIVRLIFGRLWRQKRHFPQAFDSQDPDPARENDSLIFTQKTRLILRPEFAGKVTFQVCILRSPKHEASSNADLAREKTSRT